MREIEEDLEIDEDEDEDVYEPLIIEPLYFSYNVDEELSNLLNRFEDELTIKLGVSNGKITVSIQVRGETYTCKSCHMPEFLRDLIYREISWMLFGPEFGSITIDFKEFI